MAAPWKQNAYHPPVKEFSFPGNRTNSFSHDQQKQFLSNMTPANQMQTSVPRPGNSNYRPTFNEGLTLKKLEDSGNFTDRSNLQGDTGIHPPFVRPDIPLPQFQNTGMWQQPPGFTASLELQRHAAPQHGPGPRFNTSLQRDSQLNSPHAQRMPQGFQQFEHPFQMVTHQFSNQEERFSAGSLSEDNQNQGFKSNLFPNTQTPNRKHEQQMALNTPGFLIQDVDILRTQDLVWINSWLKKRRQKTCEMCNKSSSMKISEAQEKTRHMIVLLAKFQKNKQVLETLKNEDKSIWDQKLKEVMTIKSELDSLHGELTSEENVKQLRKKIELRRKKREKLKQCKREMFERRELELVAREQKHAQIDKTMQQIIEKQKLEKQEKDMQKEADEILGQVRKKISEASKAVQLVQGIQKLRKLRTDRLERQGILSMYESRGHSSTSQLMFEAKLSNITELLNKQLDVYNAEEAALKVHLETEQEETREKEREKIRQKMIDKQIRERKKEEKMFFGSQKDAVPGDPIFPFRQYYDAASQSLEALIAIRREWDGYLTRPDLGSSIPDSWVIPPEPSSEVWASALNS